VENVGMAFLLLELLTTQHQPIFSRVSDLCEEIICQAVERIEDERKMADEEFFKYSNASLQPRQYLM
jgi:hypothetical protein